MFYPWSARDFADALGAFCDPAEWDLGGIADGFQGVEHCHHDPNAFGVPCPYLGSEAETFDFLWRIARRTYGSGWRDPAVAVDTLRPVRGRARGSNAWIASYPFRCEPVRQAAGSLATLSGDDRVALAAIAFGVPAVTEFLKSEAVQLPLYRLYKGGTVTLWTENGTLCLSALE